MEEKQRSNLTVGLLLIALGLVFLFGQLDWVYADAFRLRELWPLFLLVCGIAKFVQPADPRHPGARGGGGWMIFMAVLFLLHNYHLLPLSKSWPLFVIASGVTMLLHRHADRDERTPQGDR